MTGIHWQAVDEMNCPPDEADILQQQEIEQDQLNS